MVLESTPNLQLPTSNGWKLEVIFRSRAWEREAFR
jgi:hypothetical protein